MINNRQAGRRRGRGGGNNNGGQRNPGRPDNGNRIDNRARGNAAQLLEKYRSLAADAQRQGDRVNTEYYFQFADHYFRVLSEQRGRFEEQPRRQRDEFDMDGDDEFGDEGEPIRQGEQPMEARRDRADRPDQPERQDRPQRADRPDRAERQDRGDRYERTDRQDRGERFDRNDRQPRAQQGDRVEVAGQHRADPPMDGEALGARAEAVLEADAPLAPRPRRGRPRRDEADSAPAMDADRLPPSLMAPANDADEGGEAKPRRRRPRGTPVDAPNAAE